MASPPWTCADADTGVVAALDDELGFCALNIDGPTECQYGVGGGTANRTMTSWPLKISEDPVAG